MSKRFFAVLTTVSAALVMNSPLVSAQTLTVVQPASHADSRDLRDIDRGSAPANGPTQMLKHHGELPEEPEIPSLGPDAPDPLVQLGPGPLIAATSGSNFDGVGASGYIPSDNNIAVGPNHIVETANITYAIYTKAGVLLKSGYLGSIWTGLGACTNNGGDPVVQYDRFADRWIITQLGSLSAPYSQCIAVSKTADPTGAYSLYSYSFGSALNDYPKFGVWPTATNSAYLASYNLFYGGSGAELCAYDRAAMIAGAANPIGVCYSGLSTYSYLPADVDGSTPPLDGTPGYFVNLYTTANLGVYKLSPNFANPALTTLSAFSTIPVASFTTASDVPQPATTMKLDALSDRLMYRLGFRVYADHEAMAVTHSVNSGGIAGARWYELRSPVSAPGTFTLFQQGTFTNNNDGLHRWMGSIAMDQAGNMGIGYSVAGSARYPSIRYTGRTPADPAGTMESEASLLEGSGSQTSYDRWGDYSSMRIDPSDDCTFWYVNQYLTASGNFNWHTRIGSFKFSGCGAPATPDFSLSANPTSFTLVQGASGGSVITVNAIAGFNESTTLSVLSGCPSGATCAFNNNPVGPGGTSTLTVTTTSNTPPNTYSIVVQGVSTSSLTHTTNVALTVTPPAGDFSLTLSASTLTVVRKKKNTVTVTLANVAGGTSSPVTLSVSGLPSKATASFSTNPRSVPGSSTLTIGANPTTPTGTYDLLVTGSNGTFTHSAPLTLTIQ